MFLPKVIPCISQFRLRRLVLEAYRAAWRSSPDLFVVKIDEERAGMVTWGYVTRMRYLVYDVEPGPT